MASTAISIEGFHSFPDEQTSPSNARLPAVVVQIVKGMEPALSKSNPLWEDGTLLQLASIMLLQKDWDSYGAEPIEWSKAQQTFILLHSVMDDRTPAPVLVPTANGTIQLEWHVFGIDLEVEMLSDTNIAIWCKDSQGQLDGLDEILHYDVTPLSHILRELARRSR